MAGRRSIEHGRGSSGKGMSRRDFLKILASASAVGLAGCNDNKSLQKIFPFVRGDNRRITGIPVMFRSTCLECTAGCGIEVRTREGRAVKIEGNPDHPVNEGALCALGQSALQTLYDPDRIKQPLVKTRDVLGHEVFVPISWNDAIAKVSGNLKASKSASASGFFISGETSGSIHALLSEWCSSFGIEHVVHDPMQPSGLAQASEMVFGSRSIPRYFFEKADLIISLGADFLETWVSPVEFSRNWAARRTGARPARFIHIEPRLSLTGSNADLWISSRAGSEEALVRYLLGSVIGAGRSGSLPADVRGELERITSPYDEARTAEETEIPVERLRVLVKLLLESKIPLIISGSPAHSTTRLHALVLYLNAALGSIGKSCVPGAGRQVGTSREAMLDAVSSLANGKTRLLLIWNANPAYDFVGVRNGEGEESVTFARAAAEVDFVVSFSNRLDETARLADIILPSSTALESWSDCIPREGVFGLVQPCMQPVFDTKSMGDILINLAASASSPAGNSAPDFYEYVRQAWKRIYEAARPKGKTFENFWTECVEKGGYFREGAPSAPSAPAKLAPVVSVNISRPAFDEVPEGQSLAIYPFFTVKAWDGRAQNRSWLLELPDQMTHTVWSAWAEVHPETASRMGLAEGDSLLLQNRTAEAVFPVCIRSHVHRGIVAVPLGYGHTEAGRFERMAEGGNAYLLLAQKANAHETPSVVTVRRGPPAVLVKTSESHSQEKLGIAKAIFVDSTGRKIREPGAEPARTESRGQMYEQREHPLYHWGMTVDLASCTGCSACVVACNAENNVPTAGKSMISRNREMHWLRIDRYEEERRGNAVIHFMPLMCQHCNNAPCEPVCPVFATYHNEEGLNAMVYNRCVGTRYCSNNCPYKVRRFNWSEFSFPEPLDLQLNPEVTRRSPGVMEKCTFCIQRITEAKDRAKDLGRMVRDGEVQPACVQTCPAKALTFGNMNDPDSAVSRGRRDRRAYHVLDHEVNTQPSVAYLEDVKVEIA